MLRVLWRGGEREGWYAMAEKKNVATMVAHSSTLKGVYGPERERERERERESEALWPTAPH